MSELHDSLKKVEDIKLPSGKKINLYNHISKIKESAKVWLSGLEKNGYDHSERIEKYLDALTKIFEKQKKLHLVRFSFFYLQHICMTLDTI